MQEQAVDRAEQADKRLIPSPLNGVIPPVHARFRPGQSGNPLGRKPLSEEVARVLENDKEVKAAILALVTKAKDGDVRALELLFDRSEGKLTQRNENDNVNRTVVYESGSEETP